MRRFAEKWLKADSQRPPIGWALVAYALAYPAFNAAQTDSVSRIPTFDLPCPATILTGGLLLLASPRSRALAVVTVIWSAIGGSAAFLLGVSADYALPVTGIALAVFELQRPPWRIDRATLTSRG